MWSLTPRLDENSKPMVCAPEAICDYMWAMAAGDELTPKGGDPEYRNGDMFQARAGVKQGDQSENLYIINEGRVRITRKEDGKSEAKLVMELGQGQYFGERALLTNEPRAANVIATGDRPLKLLYISKDAFEEVLGSLQEIIDMDRQYREDVALKKQLQQESEGLANVSIENFQLEASAAALEPFQYVLAKTNGREYTIKCSSKQKVVSMGLQARLTPPDPT